MKTHPDNAAVLDNACGVLGNLALKNADNKSMPEAAVEAPALAPAVHAVRHQNIANDFDDAAVLLGSNPPCIPFICTPCSPHRKYSVFNISYVYSNLTLS